MLKKTIVALTGALMLAGSSAAMADNPLDSKTDVYPWLQMSTYQARGVDAFASARPAGRTVRIVSRSSTRDEMRLFDRVNRPGF